MFLITQIDDNPKQQIRMSLTEGDSVVLYFEYRANQQGWFWGFEYGDVNITNMRLVTSYNLLRNYSSWLPFGLRCDTQDGFEPMDKTDFATGYAVLYLLDKEDIAAIETTDYGKV